MQTESSDLGFLEYQQQQSNPSTVSSSSRLQGEVSSLFVPMQTDLVEESSVHLQSTEYKIVQRLGEIFPHLNQWKIHLKVNHYLDKMKSREKGIDVALAVNEISEAIFNAMTDLDPIRMDLASIRNNLLTGIDEEYNVTNMTAVVKVIKQLESFEISREELEATGLDMHINKLRRKAEDKALAATSPTADVALATRAKNLMKKWESEFL